MIDAVLSFHMNPQTCGVAKFNHQLAARLGVPCLPLAGNLWPSHPLISIKTSEIPDWEYWCSRDWRTFDLLLHDRPFAVPEGARRVLYADEIGCPSTIHGNPHRGAYRVLAFGMAHKLSLPHFQKLKERLDVEHPDYTIELSTAVHEGSPWDETLSSSVTAMRSIYGDRLRVLGFLGDDALAKELQEVDAVATYFVPALRANNTSYWAAVDAGKTIYTNRDELSPKDGERVTWEKLLEIVRA